MQNSLKEAKIIINGTELSEVQARAIRMSCVSFLSDLQLLPGGIQTRLTYETALNNVIRLINETTT